MEDLSVAKEEAAEKGQDVAAGALFVWLLFFVSPKSPSGSDRRQITCCDRAAPCYLVPWPGLTFSFFRARRLCVSVLSRTGQSPGA